MVRISLNPPRGVAYGVAPEKLRAVPQWRHSDVITDAERLVLEYAEAMTATPPEVTDEFVARLGEHLDDAQLVELTTVIALENMRSRMNTAFGLTSQGFSDRCGAMVVASGNAGSGG